ncbi:hypothetical protein, partial [Peribacillus sp. NPDC058002]|uniref:hypothetical protein n=1 Tax=Peribacillus sp. NPDC058002 TaxID=3346301 RepID=UPI0036DB1091
AARHNTALHRIRANTAIISVSSNPPFFFIYSFYACKRKKDSAAERDFIFHCKNHLRKGQCCTENSQSGLPSPHVTHKKTEAHAGSRSY